MPDPDSIIAPIKSALRKLVGATILLYVIVGGIAAFGAVTAKTDNDALCALRSDLQTRVTASNKFVKQHPEGFAGISVAQIKVSIKNEQSTVDALGSLSC